MSNEIELSKSWTDVIMTFFQEKCEAEEEAYLKEEIKKAQEQYAAVNYFEDNKITAIFDTKKYKKDKGEKPVDFQRRRAKVLLSRTPETLNRFRKLREYIKTKHKIDQKYTPANWLSKNCDNASSVSFATHVAKLTHSKIDTPSIYDNTDEIQAGYLTTSSLSHKAIDGAVAGNQFAPIFQFLELRLNGEKLAERVSKDDNIFEPFLPYDSIADSELLDQWTKGFRKALNNGSPATHLLAKQTYFPIKKKSSDSYEYYLLCNMISSSVAHIIYERVFDDAQKAIKKAREKRKYKQDEYLIFSNRASLNVTASNHSNASQLNGKRGGKLHLFSAQPPTWQSQLKPPINRRSLFDDLYNNTIRAEVDYLRDFLLRFKHLGLSIKDPKRLRHLERWVNNIIDEFLFYTGSIQNLPAGWTAEKNIRLKKAHQYLLDPFREDEEFQADRQREGWQKTIRNDFAGWINRQLRGKDNQFTPQSEHSRLWNKLLEEPLREHIEQIEQERKRRAGEAA
jgi:CRISPR-associated protein Csy1